MKTSSPIFSPGKINYLIWLLIFLFSCNSGTQDVEKLKQEIISADKSMSDLTVKDGFNTALLRYATDDFVKFNPGEFPAVGKDEFARLTEGSPGPKSISWQPVKADVAASGDLGYTWGNWKFALRDTTVYGNYFTVWKKQKDGSWKMALDGGNNTPPPK